MTAPRLSSSSWRPLLPQGCLCRCTQATWPTPSSCSLAALFSRSSRGTGCGLIWIALSRCGYAIPKPTNTFRVPPEGSTSLHLPFEDVCPGFPACMPGKNVSHFKFSGVDPQGSIFLALFVVVLSSRSPKRLISIRVPPDCSESKRATNVPLEKTEACAL